MKQKRIGAEALPKIRPKYTMKKWRSQRLRRGFSDYDVLNVDYYLLCVIPGMLRVLAENSMGYTGYFWSYDRREMTENDSFEAYKAELLRVADEFDRYRSLHYYEPERQEDGEQARLRLFEWLGYNLPMLWD